MTQLSDEFLLAYLDGQLEQEQTAEVLRLEDSNPEISRRAGRLRRTRAQLMETLGGFALENIAVPQNALQFDTAEGRPGHKAGPEFKGANAAAQTGGSSSRKFLFLCAVFAGGLIGGYGANVLKADHALTKPFKITDRPPAALSSWTADIAQFHSFFPREMLTPHPDAIANAEFIRYQLSRITAKALTPPDFSRQGFTLYRGQTLRYRQDNLMQLTYSSKTEPPLTLYILPADGYGDNGVAAQTFGSYRAVSWVSDRVRFLLTAEKNEEDLKILAAVAQSQMPRKP
jgi:anti-sigma factor RsiW